MNKQVTFLGTPKREIAPKGGGRQWYIRGAQWYIRAGFKNDHCFQPHLVRFRSAKMDMSLWSQQVHITIQKCSAWLVLKEPTISSLTQSAPKNASKAAAWNNATSYGLEHTAPKPQRTAEERGSLVSLCTAPSLDQPSSIFSSVVNESRCLIGKSKSRKLTPYGVCGQTLSF